MTEVSPSEIPLEIFDDEFKYDTTCGTDCNNIYNNTYDVDPLTIMSLPTLQEELDYINSVPDTQEKEMVKRMYKYLERCVANSLHISIEELHSMRN